MEKCRLVSCIVRKVFSSTLHVYNTLTCISSPSRISSTTTSLQPISSSMSAMVQCRASKLSTLLPSSLMFSHRYQQNCIPYCKQNQNTHIYNHSNTYIHNQSNTHIYTIILTHIYIYNHSNTHIYTLILTHIYIYNHSNTHIYTLILTHIYTQSV